MSLYPNIITYIPGQDKRPEAMGKRIGSLPYHFPHGTVHAMVHVAPNGDEEKAHEELATLLNNGRKAALG